MLSDEQLLHYSRHILLPQVDTEGQTQLLSSRVAIVGLGGLGSSAAYYLAASGIGKLKLIDHDRVEASNLQRQIVHQERSVGQYKVDSAKQTLQSLNREVEFETAAVALTEENGAALFDGVDLVVDCCDNFSTRFLVNRLCLQQKIPLVSASAIRLEAQISVFDSRLPNSPCYQCLYQDIEDEPLSCSESGVLAPLVGVVGSMQALEAIKVLVGFGESLIGKLLLYDAAYAEWRTVALARDPHCKACSL